MNKLAIRMAVQKHNEVELTVEIVEQVANVSEMIIFRNGIPIYAHTCDIPLLSPGEKITFCPPSTMEDILKNAELTIGFYSEPTFTKLYLKILDKLK